MEITTFWDPCLTVEGGGEKYGDSVPAVFFHPQVTSSHFCNTWTASLPARYVGGLGSERPTQLPRKRHSTPTTSRRVDQHWNTAGVWSKKSLVKIFSGGCTWRVLVQGFYRWRGDLCCQEPTSFRVHGRKGYIIAQIAVYLYALLDKFSHKKVFASDPWHVAQPGSIRNLTIQTK